MHTILMLEISGHSGVNRLPLRDGVVRVGRAADNDVVLADEPAASRHHAQLIGSGRAWILRDYDSRNGTYINGKRVSGESPVEVRDVVGIGEATLRIVEAEAPGMTIDSSGGADAFRLVGLLSEREREVLALLAAGRTDDQIGRELFISVKTVHSHLDHIREKTGVRRRAELTRLAVRLGLTARPEG